jgi:uncharacterized protein DUF4255
LIESTDRHLTQWIATVLEGTDVSLAAPSDSAPGQGISLYLMELRNAPASRGAKTPPLQISLGYLVTAWSPDPEEAHRLLGTLVFAALDNSELEVDLAPPSPGLWSAFGVVPRPSFLLHVPLRQARPEIKAKPVLQPLVLQKAGIRRLDGLLLGPHDIPLADAQVELPALQLAVRTDSKGRFSFSTVPAEPPPGRFRVLAKGVELSISLSAVPDPGKPLVIRFPTLET